MKNIFESWLVHKYIAHRGLHNEEFPENSLGAFENAILHNYAIELDVHLISDGTVVVFHDEKLDRMTNKDGYVFSLTKENLNQHNLNNTSYTIPTLEEALKFIDGKVPVLIEIKNSGKVGALEKAVISLLSNYNGEFAIQSFNPFTLNYIYQNASHIIRGQLSGKLENSDLSKTKRFFLRRMHFNKKISKPNFIAYEWSALPNKAVKKFKHLPLIAWYVQNQEEYNKVMPHCDNIIFENFFPKV